MRSQVFAAALLGRSGGVGTVSISNLSVDVQANYPSVATASYSLNNDGSLTTDISDRWLLGGTNGAGYEARVTVTSGTLSAGYSATGSWLSLATTRSWGVSRSSLGVKEATITVEIGLAGTSTAIDTATVTLSAEVQGA